MLSLVVHDALEGVDIATHYPAFYQQMLADNELREAFLDTLDLLRRSQADELLPLPQAASQDLSFLRARSSEPRVERAANGRWRILWQRTIADIQAILFQPRTSLSPLFRSAATQVEDPWFTLVNSEVDIEEQRISVLLQATQEVERPRVLPLFLTVGVLSVTDDEDVNLPLRANLRWGRYGQGVLVDKNGQANFSPVPFSAVLAEGHQSVKGHLYLTLEPVANE
jgi:hypothetical protein